jgi:hypothetical protein
VDIGGGLGLGFEREISIGARKDDDWI